MTTKLEKYLHRPSHYDITNRKIILFSDSKGRYLQPHKLPIWNIDFLHRPGCTLSHGLHWLEQIIHNLVQQHSNIDLCIWLGTCDFTSKVGQHITLKHHTLEDCFRHVSTQIDRFYRLAAHYHTVRVVFLEIPPYSLAQWFRAKGLPVSDDLHNQDLELFRRISIVNDFIREKNDRNNVQSPRFKLDLVNARKAAGKCTRRSISFKHYLDGVHPDPLLSQVWLKRLIEQCHLNNFR